MACDGERTEIRPCWVHWTADMRQASDPRGPSLYPLGSDPCPRWWNMNLTNEQAENMLHRALDEEHASSTHLGSEAVRTLRRKTGVLTRGDWNRHHSARNRGTE
jgi:hypothetical protein